MTKINNLSSNSNSRNFFLTFGGGKEWPNAARRLAAQAKQTKLFDKVITETSENFFKKNGEFLIHKNFIEANPRGWGYWLWKPLLLLKHLKRLNEGDVIIYLDAGCEILPENSKKFYEMIDYTSEVGCLFFDYSSYPILNIPFWTKQSLLDAMQEEFSISDFFNIPTIWAGGLGLVKSQKNLNLVQDWCRYSIKDNYSLLDDTPSLSRPKCHVFDHRHDQSILSILKAAYDLPSYCSASNFDFIDLGIDYLSIALAQPFLPSRNQTGHSKVEKARINPGPIGGTSSTAAYALRLQRDYPHLLARAGLLKT